MKLYIMYILIIILTIILFVVIKDKRKALKLIGILTISSSILLITISFIIKIIISINITSINISIVTNYLFLKFINTSLLLFILGLVEILISKYLHTKKAFQE